MQSGVAHPAAFLTSVLRDLIGVAVDERGTTRVEEVRAQVLHWQFTDRLGPTIDKPEEDIQ